MRGLCRAPSLIALGLLSAGTLQCAKREAQNACISVVSEPVTDAMLALPVIATLEDVAAPVPNEGCGLGAEYGTAEHRARLGPISARYTATDYKGQPIATFASIMLSSPSCSHSEVGFRMATRLQDVQLRHEEKRELYIVSNLGGTMGDDGKRQDEKSGALIVRLTPARH